MDQITTHATASRVGSAAEAPAAPEDTIDFLQPNSDFEAALRSTKDSESRFWLFYHLAYLQAFGKAAPYGQLSEKTIERISFVLDEPVPSSFTNPEGRRTFFFHADAARHALGWRRFDRKRKAAMQRWLNSQAERSDCPDFLEQGFREHARNERVLLPGQSTIERMISQARTYAQEWIAKSITSDLSESDIQSIDDLR